MVNIILTLLSAFIIGYIFYKLKITGGMMIGAIIGSAIFNIATGRGHMTYEYKFIAQVFSGAVIGCTISREDLKGMKYVFKPFLFVITMFLITNITVGFILYYTSEMDLVTSLMCAVPGGISNIPIIAIDFGANGAQVVTVQFARLLAGVGVFPTLIKHLEKYDKVKNSENKIQNMEQQPSSEVNETEVNETEVKKLRYEFLLMGLVFATLGGLFGEWIGLAGGVLLFSMVATIAIKLKFEEVQIPNMFRRVAQLLSGAYIGYTMTYADILGLKNLFVPIVIVIFFFFINCMFSGYMLQKYFKFGLQEGMLSAAPAGASDMALISADMGVSSPRLVMIQVARLIVVVSVFPQVILLILQLVN